MKPRVHYLKTSSTGRVGMIVGMILGIVGVCFLVIAGLMWGLTQPLTLACALTMLLVSLVILGLSWGVRRRFDRLPVNRLQRLDALLAHPQGAERFPHRAVEFLVRRHEYSLTHKELSEAMRRCPPGTVILCQVPSPLKLPRPHAGAISFEPVPINEADRLLALGYGNAVPEPLLAPHTNAGRTGRHKLTGWLRKGPFTRTLMLYVISGAFMLYFVGKQTLYVLEGNWEHLRRLALPLFGACLLAMLLAKVRGQVWLAPRGLIVNSDAMFSTKVKYTFRSSATHRLFYGFHKGGRVLVTVSSEKIDGRFDVSLRELYAVLTAWRSEARPPTDDEIHSFLEGRQ